VNPAALRSAAKRLPYFWRGSAPQPSVANWPQGWSEPDWPTPLRALFQWKPNWTWQSAFKLAADLLGGLLGEGDPNPLADNLGQVVHHGQPLTEKVENPICGESAIFLALLVVHLRE
jgi:hypothetical protein